MDSFSFEKYLKENNTLTYRHRGTSMLPMLRAGKDYYTIRSLEEGERPKVDDVALFRRRSADGKIRYVLHRIEADNGDSFTFLGDNCLTRECGVVPEDILGVLTEFVRNGKTIKETDPVYRCYVKLWKSWKPLRIFLKKLQSRLIWIVRKVIGRGTM